MNAQETFINSQQHKRIKEGNLLTVQTKIKHNDYSFSKLMKIYAHTTSTRSLASHHIALSAEERHFIHTGKTDKIVSGTELGPN